MAYARRDAEFSPDMSVRQTMLFHAFLREPGTHARSRDTKGRVSEDSYHMYESKDTKVPTSSSTDKRADRGPGAVAGEAHPCEGPDHL